MDETIITDTCTSLLVHQQHKDNKQRGSTTRRSNCLFSRLCGNLLDIFEVAPRLKENIDSSSSSELSFETYGGGAPGIDSHYEARFSRDEMILSKRGYKKLPSITVSSYESVDGAETSDKVTAMTPTSRKSRKLYFHDTNRDDWDVSDITDEYDAMKSQYTCHISASQKQDEFLICESEVPLELHHGLTESDKFFLCEMRCKRRNAVHISNKRDLKRLMNAYMILQEFMSDEED